MLERIGGQVELARVRLPECGEVGQVAHDVGVGNGFGDLSVVGGVSTQRRDRPRCGGRVRPCPQGCGGEHRLRADLEQHLATQIGKGAHALGEFDRLARVTAPIGAVEFHAPAERGAGAVVNQNPLWRTEIEPLRIRLEFVEDRIQQRRVERVAGVQPVTPDAVGRQPGHRLLQILRGSGQHGVGTVVGGDRQTAGTRRCRLSTRSAAANTATIRPPAGKLPKRRPRSAISSAPSSRLNTPATQAAEYWPTLWPSTTSGSKPHDCQSRARPISTANKAGWA